MLSDCGSSSAELEKLKARQKKDFELKTMFVCAKHSQRLLSQNMSAYECFHLGKTAKRKPLTTKQFILRVPFLRNRKEKSPAVNCGSAYSLFFWHILPTFKPAYVATREP